MKEGDKLMCVKKFDLNGINFEVNNFYEVKMVLHVSNNVVYRIGDIYFTEINDKSNPHCYEHFMPMWEYRENQINSILDV